MRKIILSFLLCATSFLHSQTCGGPAMIDESFSNGIPASWTVIDYDHGPMNFSDSAKGFTGQFQPYLHLGKKCVACCSQGAGWADDYIITPSLSLGSGPICLSWKASSLIPSVFSESYEVRISTTTPDSTGFNAHAPLAIFATELGPWTEHALDLSAYAGQSVYIGFRYTASGYAFYLDDIRISTPVNIDASVTSVKLTPVVAPGIYPIAGQLLNGGTSTINSMNLKWKENNGPVNTMLLSSLSIQPGSYYSFAHSVAWSATTIGTSVLKIWADNLNGNPDQYFGNDTLIQLIYVNTVPRKVLYEEFSQASCPGCFAANLHTDSIMNPYLAAGKATYIEYSVMWPGVDPMYDYYPGGPMSRASFYGISYVAHGVLEGDELNDDCNIQIGTPMCLDTHDLDSAMAIPTIFDIQITNTQASGNMNVQVVVTSHANVPLSNFTLYTVMLEDSIGYLVAPGTNGQTDFFHVTRAMLPDSTGTFLPAMTNGQTLTFNFVYPLDTQNVATNELKTVAFIQDDSTKKVFQSQVESPYPYMALGVNEHLFKNIDNIFPNPASNELFIHSENDFEKGTNWDIINIIGESIIKGNFDNGGKDQTIQINQLTPGIYFLKVDSSNGFSVQKFVKE